MKKYMLFLVVYIAAHIVLQICSGILLTVFQTPELSLMNDAGSSQSQIAFGGSSLMIALGISLLSLVIAFGITKLIYKRKD